MKLVLFFYAEWRGETEEGEGKRGKRESRREGRNRGETRERENIIICAKSTI